MQRIGCQPPQKPEEEEELTTKKKNSTEKEKGKDEEEGDVQSVKGNVIHTFVKFLLITVTIVKLSFAAITGRTTWCAHPRTTDSDSS